MQGERVAYIRHQVRFNGEDMFKINRIKISGFRRLRFLDLPMRPFMVLIGANGVGKTSLLEAFTILSASASGNLNGSLSKFGGIANILTRGKSEELSFIVEMAVPDHKPLEYELHLAPRDNGYAISREILSQKRDGYSDSEPFKHIDSSEGYIVSSTRGASAHSCYSHTIPCSGCWSACSCENAAADEACNLAWS